MLQDVVRARCVVLRRKREAAETIARKLSAEFGLDDRENRRVLLSMPSLSIMNRVKRYAEGHQLTHQ